VGGIIVAHKFVNYLEYTFTVSCLGSRSVCNHGSNEGCLTNQQRS